MLVRACPVLTGSANILLNKVMVFYEDIKVRVSAVEKSQSSAL